MRPNLCTYFYPIIRKNVLLSYVCVRSKWNQLQITNQLQEMKSKSYNKPATNYKHQCGKSNKNMWKQLKILFVPQILLLVMIHQNHVVKNVWQGTKKFNSLVRSKHYRKSWNVIARLIMYFFIRVKYDFRRKKIYQNWL